MKNNIASRVYVFIVGMFSRQPGQPVIVDNLANLPRLQNADRPMITRPFVQYVAASYQKKNGSELLDIAASGASPQRQNVGSGGAAVLPLNRHYQTAAEALRSQDAGRFLELYETEKAIQSWEFAESGNRAPYYDYEVGSCNQTAQANALALLNWEVGL